jgi:hypothetical protein
MQTTECTEHLFFPCSLRADYNDLENCMKGMIYDGKVSTISAPVYAQ